MCLYLNIVLELQLQPSNRNMAYWSSTGYNHYASESSPYDPRNAKPRWQQLAEIAQEYSFSSDPLSTVTAPTTNQNFEQMERRNRSSRNGGDVFWNRRSRAHDGNVASLGASRSRSQSRRSRTRTTITEEFAPRRRSESPQTHGCLSTFWKSVLSIYLLALLKNVLVWYEDSGLSDARTVRRSVQKRCGRHMMNLWLKESDIRFARYRGRNSGQDRGYQKGVDRTEKAGNGDVTINQTC